METYTFRCRRKSFIIICKMADTFNVVIRRWGNSLGAVLPNSIIQKNNLKENDKIKILIIREGDVLRKTFGKLKGKVNQSSQDMKEGFRKNLYG